MWSSMPEEIIKMIRALLEDEITILYADTDSIMIKGEKKFFTSDDIPLFIGKKKYLEIKIIL